MVDITIGPFCGSGFRVFFLLSLSLDSVPRHWASYFLEGPYSFLFHYLLLSQSPYPYDAFFSLFPTATVHVLLRLALLQRMLLKWAFPPSRQSPLPSRMWLWPVLLCSSVVASQSVCLPRSDCRRLFWGVSPRNSTFCCLQISLPVDRCSFEEVPWSIGWRL